MAAENFIDCDCSVLIEVKTSHIEYWDKVAQIWKQMYPPFRLYNDPHNVELATLTGADGRSLLLEAGCPVRIGGNEYTDFNDVRDAIQSQIVDFFFNLATYCLIRSGTTAQRPTNPPIGTPYIDFTIDSNGLLIFWNGTNWINCSAAIIVP